VIGFDLLRAELAWLFAVAAAVLAAGLWALAARRRQLARLVASRRLGRFAPGLSATRPALRLGLATAALGLFAFSLLGPVRGYTEREAIQRGLDLVLCIDTSRSMLARDLRPSRLERAKREIGGLLDQLEGDRCALIAFSGDAREVAPLTRDRSTLRGLLRHVGPDDNRRGGTDLATAITSALSLFDGRTGAHEAVVLLTDGEDLEGRAGEVAEEAAARGIRIYVVGIGTEGGGKIPVVAPSGRESFLVDPDGAEVVSRLDGTSLAALAGRTGGEYLSVEMSPTPLEELYRARISRLEGRELSDGMRRVPHDRYQWTLALALACMLAEMGLRDGRPPRSGDRRTDRVPTRAGSEQRSTASKRSTASIGGVTS